MSDNIRWECGAKQRHIGAEIQDCDWPGCGCDPYASKVLDAIDESGFEIVRKAGWRPIETAPKDGTPFLCFHPDPDKLFSPRTGIDLIWYEPSIKTYTQDGDTEVLFAGITHWMPLPEPPVSK